MAELEVQLHLFLTLALVGVNGQLGTQATLALGKEPKVPIDWGFGWTPRAGVDILEKRKIYCSSQE
jgi:hypothetical protein